MNFLENIIFTRPRRGEIWICNLKQNTGSEQNGSRPCIVLNTPDRLENTCVIIPASGTIRKHSFVFAGYNFLLHQIRVIDHKRLIRLLTRLSKAETEEILVALWKFFHK